VAATRRQYFALVCHSHVPRHCAFTLVYLVNIRAQKIGTIKISRDSYFPYTPARHHQTTRTSTSDMFSPALLPTCIFIFITSSQLVTASIHPYKPISTTSYTAGELAQVSWLDDYHRPKLGKVGPMRIDLFAESDVCHRLCLIYQ
jgi:hypothetical protein